MYTVMAQFQRYMSEIKAMIVYSFEPIFGALAGVIILHEILSRRLLAGGACVIIAMVLSDLKSKPPPDTAYNTDFRGPLHRHN